MGRHKTRRQQGPKRPPKRLAKTCSCGKLGWASEAVAMDAIISGRYSRAGVRAYRCPDSGLWHTTSMRRPPRTPRGLEPLSEITVDDLTDEELDLVKAVRRARKARAQHSPPEVLGESNNAAQAALSAAIRPTK